MGGDRGRAIDILASADMAAGVRCPSTTTAADGTPRTVIGCGALIPDVRDDEGLVDCPACGIWFNPDEEK